MSCSSLAPDIAICGDGGTCIGNNTCACIDGWTGLGDFVYGQPSCNTYLPAVKYEWLAVAIVHFLSLPVAVDYLYRVLFRSFEKSYRKRATPITFSSGIIASNAFIGATAAQKVADPARMIGTDVSVTVTFFLGSSAFYLVAFTAMSLFLELNMKNAKIRNAAFREKYGKIVLQIKRSQPALVFLTLLCMSMPMFMLASSSSQAFFALALLHYVGAASLIALYGLSFVPTLLNPLRYDIRKLLDQVAGGSPIQTSKEFDKLRLVESRLKMIVREIRNQAFINFPPAILFGCWPFLQSCSSYFLPLPWFTVAVTMFVLMVLGAPADQGFLCLRSKASVSNSSSDDERSPYAPNSPVNLNKQGGSTLSSFMGPPSFVGEPPTAEEVEGEMVAPAENDVA